MNEKIDSKIKEYLRKKEEKRRLRIGTTIISIFLSVIIVYASILPAVTMTEREENLMAEVGYSENACDNVFTDEIINNVDSSVEMHSEAETAEDEMLNEVTEFETEVFTNEICTKTSEDITTNVTEITTYEEFETTTEIVTESTTEIISSADFENITEITTEYNDNSSVGNNVTEITTDIYEITSEVYVEKITEVNTETTTLDVINIEDKLENTETYKVMNITDATNIPEGEYLLVCKTSRNVYYLVTNTTGIVQGANGILQYEIGKSASYIVGDYADNALWTVKKGSTGDNTYNFSINGGYINIKGSKNVTISSEPQDLEVNLFDTQENGISLYGNNNYLNCFGAGIHGGFSGWNEIDANALMFLYQKTETIDAILTYDINVPKYSYIGKGWKTYPTIDNSLQDITDGMQILSKPDGWFNDVGPAGVTGLYRMNIGDDYGLSDPSNTNSYVADEFPYYKEFSFEGWVTSDINGNRVLVDTDSIANIDENNYLVVQGREVVIGSGKCISHIGKTYSTYKLAVDNLLFTGGWRRVSSPIKFFVNYNAAIVNTEGDILNLGRNDFTGVVAIGHLFFGTETIGATGDYVKVTNEKITSLIGSEADFDYYSGESKIVIKYATVYENGESKHNHKNPDINQSELETSLLNWIRADSSINIYVCTADGKEALVSNENATPDNYNVSWYVLKEQHNGWHCDGILVAKTRDLVVTKSFAGIDQSDIDNILKNYCISVKFNDGDYLDLTTNSEVNGHYTYNGYNNISKTATWTLPIPVGEKLSFEEKNYDNTGYTVFNAIVVDGNTENVEFRSDTYVDNIISGTNNNIAFNNVYVSNGKGILAIIKKDALTGKALPNAAFSLVNKDNPSLYNQIKITNQSGIVVFYGLEVGNTYILTETIPPEGYELSFESREVNVSSVSGNVVVNLEGNNYYTEGNTVVKLYDVTNSSNSNSIKVKKTFRNISSANVSTMVNNYQINYTVDNKSGTFLLNNASNISTDGLTYEWYINDIDDGSEIRITEKGYYNSSYDRVNVKVKVNGVNVVPNIFNNMVEVVTTKSNGSNEIEFINTYSNNFALNIVKKDKYTDELLEKADFKLYGPFSESTNTSDRISVKNENGTLVNYYYIKTMTTDATGEVLTLNLKPEEVYYIKEVTAPLGYKLDDTLIKLDASVEDINNGIVTKNIYNIKSNGLITINKVWRLNDVSDLPDSITFVLFRKLGENGTTELLGSYTFNVTDSSDLECILNSADGLGFPWYDENGTRYYYYVGEEAISNFALSFDNDDNVEKFRYNGKIYYGLLVEPSGEIKNIYNVYTNIPEAGGNTAKYNISTGIIGLVIIWLSYILTNFPKIK